MAVRFRKGRASPWQVYWNNPITGKRECKNFFDQKEAEKHDALIKYRIKYEKDFFQPEVQEETTDNVLTLQSLYLEYLKAKRFDKISLVTNVSSLREILDKLGSMDARDITKDVIKPMIEKALTTQNSPTTVRKKFANLRAILNFGVEKGWLEKIDFPKLPACQTEKLMPPTPKELGDMLAVAPEHIRRVIIIGSQCGVRIGKCELFELQWKDVDFDRAVLCVHGAKKNPNAPWREIPLRQSLLDIMRVWHDIDSKIDCPYIINFNGRAINRIKQAWQHTLRRAGITRRIRPYDLRHAFATEAIAGGADVGTVASLMGHANPVMLLKHYQYILNTQKRAAIESLPELKYVPNAMCPKFADTDFSNQSGALYQ